MNNSREKVKKTIGLSDNFLYVINGQESSNGEKVCSIAF